MFQIIINDEAPGLNQRSQWKSSMLGSYTAKTKPRDLTIHLNPPEINQSQAAPEKNKRLFKNS